ncbi:MAG: hypothetical protein MI673_03205, partial [Thiotrichales bacterium]|nr:hypothetical protein [Thiotrichales bacterium]
MYRKEELNMTLDDNTATDNSGPDALTGLNEKTPQMFPACFTEQLQHVSPGASVLLNQDMARLWTNWWQKPWPLLQAAQQFWQDCFSLTSSSVMRLYGLNGKAVITPDKNDRRFSHEYWDENLAFDHIKQFYLLASRLIYSSLPGNSGLDGAAARKLEFYTRQWVDAMSPANFLATNPVVLEETINSRGANLLRGMQALIEDMYRGRGKTLLTRMTDSSAFEIGRNIATTEGKVIYQTDMFQLIQYAPTTSKV